MWYREQSKNVTQFRTEGRIQTGGAVMGAAAGYVGYVATQLDFIAPNYWAGNWPIWIYSVIYNSSFTHQVGIVQAESVLGRMLSV